jgi:arylsulfatase A-like enzyme
MLAEIKFVDAAIGEIVAELKSQGLNDSTAIIITAKHGQSPIDPNLFFPIPGHAPLNNGTPPSDLLGPTFLSDSPDQSNRTDRRRRLALMAHGLGLDQCRGRYPAEQPEGG